MAFNPFHRFRKHQKVFFAGLTIVCMFVFVLQFGSGDPITRTLAWLAGGRNRGTQVTTLYGSKVYEADLEKVLSRRNLANSFMFSAAALGNAEFVGTLQARIRDDKTGAISPNVKDIVQRYGQRQMFAQMGFRTPESYRDVKRDLVLVRNIASAPDAEKKPEEARTLEELAVALGFQAWMFSPEAGDFYFGGSKKPEDLLDFLVWKHQADQLHITLTEADVRREVTRAAAGRDLFEGKPFVDSLTVQKFLTNNRRSGPGTRPQDLLEALTDELRASMAQEALLGQPSGARAWRADFGINTSPAVATPDEFLRYYRSVRTTLKVALLPVAVEKFLPEVKGSPSEGELVNLYEKYKDQEPAPDKVEPGFKEPRKVRVQYVAAGTEDAYYKEQARKAAQVLGVFSDPQRSALLRLTGPLNAFAPAGPAGLATRVGFPLAFDPLRREYEAYLSAEQAEVEFHKLGLGFDLQDRSALPLSAFGQVLGAGLSRTGPLTVPLANRVTIALHERATVQAFAASVLGGATNSPLSAMAVAYPSLRTRQPFDVVRPKLLEKFETDLANQLLRENLETMRKELAKLKNRPEEAEQYLKKAVQEYHLRFSSMDDLRTQYTLPSAPALKALKEAYSRHVSRMGGAAKDAGFAAELLGGTRGAYEAQELQADKELFLFWRAEDRPAKVLPFEAVRGQVEEAWRFRQARALALRRAEAIDAELKKRHSPADAVNFLREQKLGDVIELTNVAQLTEPERLALMTPAPVYQPYQPPEDKVAYPRPDFVKELLTLTKPGDSKVLRDKPVAHFYVAVLQDRSVPSLQEFYKIYQRAGDDNPIWADLMTEQRRNYRKLLLGQMRVEAAGPEGVDAEGTFKVPEDVRVRSTDSRD